MNSQRKRKVIVIGAGIAGLAAAIRLARLNFTVTLLEANDTTGGNITELIADGFRFDAGPSILTKPEYLRELFLLWDKNPDDYLRFKQVDPLFRYFFPDGSSIDSFSDREKFRSEVETKTREPFAHVSRLLDDSGEIFRLTNEVFLQRTLHDAKNYFNWPTLRGILLFNRVRAFQSMHDYNRKKFRDERLVRLFNRFAGFNGSDPYAAPATLNVITHFAINEGSWLPEGGMINIARALTKLAQETGVEIRLNTKAERITFRGNRITGVDTNHGHHEADVVVSNADVHTTYATLLPGRKIPSRVERQPRSSSVIVFYWGIRKTFPSLALHNTFFGANDKAEFDAIFRDHTVPADPSIYLYQSSLYNPSDAPEGMSNWFVMVSVPGNDGQDWDRLVRDTKSHVLRKLSSFLGADLSELIVSENILSPPGIEKKTGAWKGSIYGNSSNSIFSAFLRHPNFSRKMKGLYFTGGSVHPGPGIPLCLLSAKITAGLIAKRENG